MIKRVLNPEFRLP